MKALSVTVIPLRFDGTGGAVDEVEGAGAAEELPVFCPLQQAQVGAFFARGEGDVLVGVRPGPQVEVVLFALGEGHEVAVDPFADGFEDQGSAPVQLVDIEVALLSAGVVFNLWRGR